MVWGMALPRGFGDFFPGGNFVGWREELTQYFREKMPAEQKALFADDVSSYRYYVAENFTYEPGIKLNADLPPFGPIAAHEAPKCFETEKRYSSLGSLIELNDRIVAVDGPMKDIIERHEPGKHHFFPIEIVMPKKVIYPQRYFVMAIGQYLDSFSLEQSDPGSWRESSDKEFGFFEDTKKAMSGLALSKRVFGDVHLWRERRMLSPLICFSEQLRSEFIASGLRLPKLYPLKEV